MSQEIKICSADSGCFLGGLSAVDTIYSENKIVGGCIVVQGGASSQFIKANGTLDSATYTTCTGDVTGIDAGTAITVSDGSTSTPCVGVTSSCNSAWNAKTTCTGTLVASDLNGLTCCTGTTTPSNVQTFTNKSGNNSQWTNDAGYTTCTGTLVAGDISGLTCCTGTTTPSNTQTFTNKSGNISQWSNNSGYTTCIGTLVASDLNGLTCCTGTLRPVGTITTNDYAKYDLNGCLAGRSASEVRSDLSLGTAALCSAGSLDQSSCAGINCTGTLVSSDLAGLTCCTGTTTPSNTQTFTNKSGSNSQWTNDAGYTTCTGDITNVSVGTGLDGGGGSGSVTISLDLSELADGTAAIAPASDEVIYLDGGTQKRKLFSEIFGNNAYNSTTIATNNNQLTNGCGFTTCTGTLVAGDISGLTCCTGTTTASNTQTFTNKSGNISQWTNNSGYTTCTGTLVPGDLAGLTCCTGTTTPSNTQTFTNKSGNISQWTNNSGYTTCNGDITGVTAGDGLGGGGTSGSVSVAVDSTVARTNADETFSCDVTINGDLTVNGDLVCLETIVSTTSALSVVNHGSGPAITVNQAGSNDIVDFRDDNTSVFFIENGGNVGLGDTNPAHKLDVSGNINATGSYKLDDSDVINSGKCFVGAQVRPTTKIADAYISSASTWNAKTTCTGTLVAGDIAGLTCCTGTTTPSNTQTFTNKSGNISQWTNNSGYTTCTGTLVAGDISGLTCCTGTVTGITAGNAGIDVGTGTTPSVSLDLSELADGTGAIVTGTDEIIYLDASVQKRKRFSEIFGNNAYNSTTIATNNNQLTNGCGFTTCTGTLVASDISGLTCCTGTTTASNTQTFTNKSGSNSQWTNDAGYTTCTGDITGVTAGSLLDGGGSSGSVTLNVDLSELTDGTAAVVPSTDEIVYLDAGSQKRKLFSEIFGCNAYSSAGFTTCTGTVVAGDISSFTSCTGTTTPSNAQTFTNKGGNISQWTNDSGYTTCTGTVVAGDISGFTSCTGTTTPSNTQTFTNKSGNISQWTNNSGYTTCTGTLVAGDISGLTCCTGTVTSVGISPGTGLDAGGAITGSGTISVTLDLSELTDMTAAVSPTVDEVILLDNGAERRKRFSEIFGCNAYSDTAFTTCTGTVVAGDISGFTSCTGTTTPSNTQTFTNKSGNISQWTNNSGYTTCTGTVVAGDISGFTSCTGTTTPSNTQTFTNKSGSNSQWTNDAGYTTCTGDITGVTAGTLLDGGGSSGSVTLNVDLSELTDGTAAVVPSTDEIVYLDAGSQKRKLFSEIFGCNAYSSAGFTTCTGTVVASDISSFTTCTGTTTPSNTQTFTNKSGNISQWTNNSGYTTCTGTVVAGDISSFTSCVGTVTNVQGDGSTITVVNGTTDACVGVHADCDTAWNAKTTCTGTTTPSNTQTFTNKGGNISQWTNDCGYTQCTGTTTPSNTQTFTNKSGNISQWTNDSNYTANATTCTGNLCGDFAQKVLTTNGSVCLGKCAGKSITEGTGTGNIFLGACTGCTTSTGDANLAIGKQALQNNSTGSRNVAIGDLAGFRITGSDNLVFGRAAGCGISSGSTNVAIGNYAMRTTTNNGTSIDNVALGNQAMQKITSGSKNVAIGFCANQLATTGQKNISIGACANANQALNGNCNIALGEAAMWKTTSGSNNFAVGFATLGCNSTGSDNIAIGRQAGRLYSSSGQVTAGTHNIFLGYNAKAASCSTSSPTNQIVIGCGAQACGNNMVKLGNSSITVVCSQGTFSTVSDKRDKTCICNLELGLDFIGDLKPKTFNMITDRNDPTGSISCKRHGFIAQEVLELEGSDNVIINKENPDQLGYTGEHIIPILVKGMQEQQAMITSLTERIKVLES